jgi:hypothetical protein
MEVGDGVFIRDRVGVFLFFGIVALTFYSFLGVLDVTPPAFSVQEVPEGIFVDPKENLMPSGNRYTPYWMALAMAVLMFGLTRGFHSILDRKDWNERRPLTYWVAVTGILAILYAGIFYGGLWLDTGIETTRHPPLSGAPTTVWIFIILHSLLVGLLCSVYQRRLLPPTLNQKRRNSIEVYMRNQWRVGRMLVAVSIAFLVGVSIPIAQGFSGDTLAIYGLLFLWGSILPPLLGIALFQFFRVLACQNLLLNRAPRVDWWRYR